MEMKKKGAKRKVGMLLLLVAAVVCFSACFTAEPGKTAYEIACENGFAGTVEEWLDSLKGRDGTNGSDASVDVYALYEAYLSENPNAAFGDFMSSFEVSPYSTEYAVANGIQSAVSVYSTFSRRVTTRPGQTSTSDYSASGAGVVYQLKDGYAYIITNYHVVYDRNSNSTEGFMAKKIEVYSYGQEHADKAVTAEFAGGSITKDIAVIKAEVSGFADDVQAVRVADSNRISLGESVVTIGNPLGETISVSAGIISVDSEEIEMEALDSAAKTITLRVLRTDAPINSGNSGGGLFNLRGELIGIVNAKTVQSGVESMGYAIPSNVATGIADCVIENDAQKCALGITVTALNVRTQYNAEKNRVELIETVVVDSVSDGGLASGKLLKDDKILAARIGEGEELPVTRLFYLSDYLYGARPGDTVYLRIERGGVQSTVEVVPGAEHFGAV